MTISLETLKKRNNNLINRIIAEFGYEVDGSIGSSSVASKNLKKLPALPSKTTPTEMSTTKSKEVKNGTIAIDSSSDLVKFSRKSNNLKKDLKAELKDFWQVFNRQIASEYINEAESFKVLGQDSMPTLLDKTVAQLIIHHLLITKDKNNEELLQNIVKEQKCKTVRKQLARYVKIFRKSEDVVKHLKNRQYSTVVLETESLFGLKKEKMRSYEKYDNFKNLSLKIRSNVARRFFFCISVLEFFDELQVLNKKSDQSSKKREWIFEKLNFIQKCLESTTDKPPETYKSNQNEISSEESTITFADNYRLKVNIEDNSRKIESSQINEMIELVKLVIDKKPNILENNKQRGQFHMSQDSSIRANEAIKKYQQLYHNEAIGLLPELFYKEFDIPTIDPLINLYDAGCSGITTLCENKVFSYKNVFKADELEIECMSDVIQKMKDKTGSIRFGNDTNTPKISNLKGQNIHQEHSTQSARNRSENFWDLIENDSSFCEIHSINSQKNKQNNSITGYKSCYFEDDEIPIELPFSEQHHSMIICPVLKTPCDNLNPPLVLECFHVISREAVKRLNMVKGVFDCPYCPAKSDISKVFEIFYE
ncbi:putative E3 ubiquitin ligase [Pseudoloma neurophilia]|uniref:Putative E3 ubiquitin ligase n=1 Tax=Pseudoloma neurophilia TaxID=146866 RepID=A0A0R0LWZ1_9MICR|nr:putative E3 ubiquitin ligase [Pseudoloma neurophilia]